MLYDVLIIGAGVAGCALARHLSRFQLKIAVLDKEADVGDGISRANSGVLHAGFNVPPGSLKAVLNVEGVGLFFGTAGELGVDYNLCGKIVTAREEGEFSTLDRLMNWGEQNGCRGLSIIEGKDALKLQSGIEVKRALLSEKTAVFSPFRYTIALAENARQNGVDFFMEKNVTEIGAGNGGNCVRTDDGEEFRGRWIINAAGLGAGKLASELDPGVPEVYPCRGEYQILDKTAASLLNMAVYPVPPAHGKGLGIHITPTPEGNILIGPSADYIGEPVNTDTTKAVQDILTDEARQLLPELKHETPIRTYSGIRPKLSPPGSGEFRDYYIRESTVSPRIIHLLGIESPGLTAAPAIARYVTDTFIKPLEDLIPSASFDPVRRVPGIVDIPNGHEILCRCEQISNRDVAAAVQSLFGPITVQALKKRTRVTAGRCQGGYCLPRLVHFLREEFGIKPEGLTLRGGASRLFY